MKFGKKLEQLIEEALPEWRDKFLSYRDLKKLIKLMSPRPAPPKENEEAADKEVAPPPYKRQRIETQEMPQCAGQGKFSDSSSYGSNQAEESTPRDQDRDQDLQGFTYKLTTEETAFIELLNPELEKFNLFFMEKEEEYIIRQKELQERIQKVKDTYDPNGTPLSRAKYKHEMIRVRKDIVNFHGEMVLLENYSVLNYTGLVKILKKYDKRTGGILRLAFIQRVLEQPFFTMELLFKLVKECEETLQRLFEEKYPEEEIMEGEEEAVYLGEEDMYRSTMAALRSMREMRKASSTSGPLSLPPLPEEKPCVLSSSATPICPQG